LGSGCSSSLDVTVNELPDVISGTASTCIGSTSSLSSSPAGGVWTSSNTSVATVGASSGVVTGATVGTTRITYTVAGSCYATVTFTVGATPAAITGNLSLCNGSTTALSSATTGGTWSSDNTSVATVDAGTGVVTGTGTGTATITYTNGVCARTAFVTVNAGTTANAGDAVVCVGQASDLNNATSGGTWSSSNASIASVNITTGLVSGVAAGTASIT
jgi:uncharacterized protein YjdB